MRDEKISALFTNDIIMTIYRIWRKFNSLSQFPAVNMLFNELYL